MALRPKYEPWVLGWIAGEKAKGRKCFDVKRTGNSYYVYYQTTRYNSESKKREKVSGYIGRLIQGIGLVEPERCRGSMGSEVSVSGYGCAGTRGTFADPDTLTDNSVIAETTDVRNQYKQRNLAGHTQAAEYN